MLNSKELERYSRQLILPEIGKKGQQKLKTAKVLVVGAGGLGNASLIHLVAAGVGTIGLVDFDTVALSNLHRQTLFQTQDLGRFKVQVAKERLEKQNPHVSFHLHNVRLDSRNALDIIAQYDVVLDGTDNFYTRYLVNDACVILGKTNVYASVFKFEGQVSVFNDDENSPNYRDLFPTPPKPNAIPNCSESGILSAITGIIGAIQANEAIKIITSIGIPLVGKLFVMNMLTMQTHIVRFYKQKTASEIVKLPEEVLFCENNIYHHQTVNYMKSITVKELKTKLDNQENIQVIDVRESDEYDIANIGATLIPMGQIEQRLDEIRRDVPVVIHCKSGGRSSNIINYLEMNYKLDNLYNLTGGILAYIDEIDGSLTKY